MIREWTGDLRTWRSRQRKPVSAEQFQTIVLRHLREYRTSRPDSDWPPLLVMDFEDELAWCELPALVFRSREDKDFSFEHIADMARTLRPARAALGCTMLTNRFRPEAELSATQRGELLNNQIPNGHLRPLEDPDAIEGYVMNFVETGGGHIGYLALIKRSDNRPPKLQQWQEGAVGPDGLMIEPLIREMTELAHV